MNKGCKERELLKERGGERVEVLFCHTIITDHKLWLCAQIQRIQIQVVVYKSNDSVHV